MTGNGDVRYFHNLLPDEQQKILNYKLTIYVCEGIISSRSLLVSVVWTMALLARVSWLTGSCRR